MIHWQTIRMVLLMLCLSFSSVAAYVLYEAELYFCVFFACVLVLILIAQVVSSYSQGNRRLGRMIESIRHGDFSLSYSINRHSRMEKRLVEDINEVMTDLRSKISAQEERYRYYETLLDTVDTCMLVTDKEGKVINGTYVNGRAVSGKYVSARIFNNSYTLKVYKEDEIKSFKI